MSEYRPLTEPQRKRAQNAALLSQLFAIMITMVVSGQYMILYANDVLGFSPQQIALIFSLAPFASIFRLPMISWIERIGLTVSLQIARVGQILIIISLLLIPADLLSFPLLAGLILIFVLFRELGLSTVWGPLMQHITTDDDRGTFFARMRASFTMVNLSLSAGVALLIGQKMEATQYKIILAVCILGSLNSIFWSRRIPEPPKRGEDGYEAGDHSMKGLWKLFKTSPLFRIPLLVTLTVSLAELPIAIVYFREALHVPANLMGAQIFCATLGQVLSLLLWGKISDSLGFRPMLAGLLWLTLGMSLLIWIIPVFPYDLQSSADMFQEYLPGIIALMLYGFGNGVLLAGLGIATTAVNHYHVNAKNSLAALNLFALIQLLFQAAIMLVIGVLLQKIVIPQSLDATYHTGFTFDWFKAFRGGLVPLLMLLSIPAVLKLPNLKPWIGVSDFFAVFRYNPFRSMLGGRRIYDENESQRIQFARSLGETNNPLNLSMLGVLLKDPSYEVKVETIRSLAYTGSDFAGEELLKLLKDPEWRGLWNHAAWGLGELKYQCAVDLLIERLEPNSPPRVRGMAARALGKLKNPKAIQPLLDTLENETMYPHIISACSWALLQIENTASTETAFLSIIKLREREERYELLSILSRMMGISDRWILISDSRTSAHKCLHDYIETFSKKWKQEREFIIQALENQNKEVIHQALTDLLDLAPINELLPQRSLSRALEKTESWTPVTVLAAAWLLLK
ncbi:MAG: MFS transporter [Verrucomicrobia bacterium]|nr:MFS transporter [Verrucomicrobiota bacterium]